MAVSIDELLRKAQSSLKAGKPSKAAELYKQVLSRFPKNKRAILGYQKLKAGITSKDQLSSDPPEQKLQELSTLNNHGQFEETLSKLKPLVSVFPESVALRHIQAASNAGLKKYDAAIESYKRALKIKPDYFAAHFNMGNILKGQGRHEEAIEAYKKSLSLKPDCAEAYNNMGNAHQEQGKLEEAIEAYSQALCLKPDYSEAYLNMGTALQEQGKLEKAIEAYNNALSLRPDYPEAYLNMGNTLQEQGKLEKAIETYNNALSLKPDYPEAYFNIGNILKEQGRHEEAIEAYKKSLSLKPDFSESYNNMGNALQEQNRHEEAIEAYKKVLLLKPDYEASRVQKLHQLEHICNWDSIQEDSKLIPDLGTSNNFVSPFAMLSLEDAPDRHRLRSETYAKFQYPQEALPLPAVPTKKPKRIRIGYFSTDFRDHPVANVIAKVFELHNRVEFEVFGYSLQGSSLGDMRQRLENSFDYFTDVQSMSDKDIALRARQDKIDIGINLNGYTQNSRAGIFAYRAAPIQINYLGYPGTMGADFMDYIIADDIIVPEHQRTNYSEEIIYLPNCYMPQDNTKQISDKPISRAECGLPENGFVFCCFNNAFKISPREFDIWMQLLKSVEGSVIWLMKTNKWAEDNLRNEAKKRGIKPSRLVFADNLPLNEHLRRIKNADLFLDTFNFNAHTTVSDALWAGLPVVTKIGKGFAARVAGSLLSSIELPELITNTEQEYEALALSLATDPLELAKIRKKLAHNRLSAPLFDTETYTKNLEKAYTHTYWRYTDGLPPAEFKIP